MTLRIAVIGAGASGIAAAARMRAAGHETTVFEKAARLGGTWRENRYPGVACDIPSHLYRYSFAPNPDWTTEYAGGAEILAYLDRAAEALGVAGLIRCGEEVRRAELQGRRWRLTTTTGDAGAFDMVIAAMGVLHKPVLPAIPGRERFAGPAFHSARWPEGLALDGLRVGVIGTGSSATQIVSAAAEGAARIDLFQRTPQWIFSVPNRPIAEAKRAAFAAEPERMRNLYDLLGEAMNGRFAAALVGRNPEALAEIEANCRANLARVRDPDLRARLTPDYAVGCKRLVISDRFYDAIQRPNARLVTDPIAGIEPEGVRTAGGALHALDVLVFATGFDTFNFHRPTTVLGRGGRDLDAEWAVSSRALRSVAVPGFPNFFFVGGPNSPIGNFSFLMTAEAQVGFIEGLAALIEDGGTPRLVAPREEATQAWNARLEAAMPATVWAAGGCSSWYFDRSGKVASWPWTYEDFTASLARPNPAEFEIA
ncbi:flavin-containing monooxygenase [Albimonas pacifica]|uniref:Cyclohexanone monooxygenase n=1 Tax=Albimonas pacifica TaxID=1114924 RepID=A0A1I3BY83_9RHOB|nr:NAD(P)/FAD-dependent oxidoreductase [Albimonas pacifica]SFH67173.1 cyclohexanone monooxygenase [Albimonas pacifica]